MAAAAVADWRQRAVLTIAETARLLSVSTAHVRRHFELVRVAGLPRVRVSDVMRELGEEPERQSAPAMPRPDRRADRFVAQILRGER